MENLVTAIVWFGNTVVICIAAMVIYCMINQGEKQYGVYNEVRINRTIHWCIGVGYVWYSDYSVLVDIFDVVVKRYGGME